jgi:hypothetical protein
MLPSPAASNFWRYTKAGSAVHHTQVFLTYTVFDEAVGEEVERLEVVPCRRCADAK